MKIITCFKLVPEEPGHCCHSQYTLISTMPTPISQFDLNAIEAASQLATDDDEIAALTVGSFICTELESAQRRAIPRAAQPVFGAGCATQRALPIDTRKSAGGSN